jgi:adenosine kinase
MGMGNPLLDISANVSPDMLKKYNVQLDTAILAEEQHLPIYQELIDTYPDSVQYIAGGATQNTCRVAQWMLSAAGKPKECVAFLGCVGADDAYGQKLQACAEADGVCVHYQKDPAHPTGTCAALIVEGERALIANLGAANHFQPSHLTDSALSQEILAAAQIVYCAGFFLTVSVPSLVYAAEHVVQENKIFALNLSAPFIVDFFSEQLHTALEYADYLFGNESEAETYAKKHNLTAEADGSVDLHQVALALAAGSKKNAARPRTVVITQGSKATIVACSGTVTEYPIEEALAPEKIVDTNGAGDAFVGGFLAALLLRTPAEVGAAVRAGHYAAKHIIQVSGTQLTEPCNYTF